VLVISGTGSVVVGRDEKGQVHRVGGWGHLFGDEGSAYDIAREALRTAAKKVDAGVGSPLIEGLCRWGAVGEFVDLLPLVYGRDMDKRRLAMLSGFLFEEMRDLPDVAALFAEAADRLVRQVEALLALGTFKEAAPVPLFLVGSVLEKNAMVRDRVLERLAGSGVRGATAQHAPHWGAAIWARERFG
jgi:N-acetylglucosamine kinase-like BadF-type ATPase